MEVVLVPTGLANIASVRVALERLGARVELSDEARRVDEAAAVVLPGVGAFGAGAERLRARGVAEALARRVERERPTLAICLGLQLLAASSDESPGARGLGVVAAHVERFPASLTVPHMGWNRVTADEGSALGGSGEAYFANSFCLREAPAGYRAAWTDYGGRFVASLERGAVLACQFHPELSGAFGAALLGRWLATARREEAAC